MCAWVHEEATRRPDKIALLEDRYIASECSQDNERQQMSVFAKPGSESVACCDLARNWTQSMIMVNPFHNYIDAVLH